MRLLIISLFLSTLSGCYFGRQLDHPVTMYIDEAFELTDATTIENIKYVNYTDLETYKSNYLQGLRTDLSNANVTFVKSAQEADYVLSVQSITLIEGEKEYTVSDADSEFNGQTYILNTCEVNAEVTLSTGAGKKVDNWTIYANKDEKVKNNRNLSDLISGDNKDNNTYRQKLLSESVFVSLSSKCGSRTGAKVSTKISRKQKKG